MIRQAAVQAGGLVAVARNPVTASFVRQNGAPGAIGKCIEVGRAILEAPDGEGAGAEAAAKAAGGRVAARGMVSRVDLTTTGGFDVGSVTVDGECGTFEMVFWNEYMTLEQVKPAGVKRLATFPRPDSNRRRRHWPSRVVRRDSRRPKRLRGRGGPWQPQPRRRR